MTVGELRALLLQYGEETEVHCELGESDICTNWTERTDLELVHIEGKEVLRIFGS